jgi:hypothetical protein
MPKLKILCLDTNRLLTRKNIQSILNRDFRPWENVEFLSLADNNSNNKPPPKKPSIEQIDNMLKLFPNLKGLNLKGNNMKTTIIEFFNMIHKYENVVDVNIGDCSFNHDDSEVIAGNFKIESFEISRCGFNGGDIQEINKLLEVPKKDKGPEIPSLQRNVFSSGYYQESDLLF